MSIQGWKVKHNPDPVIAGAILGRIAHRAYHIQLKGESVRKKLAQKSKKKNLPL
ncbi:MAG: ATP-binding protein [bacterium]